VDDQEPRPLVHNLPIEVKALLAFLVTQGIKSGAGPRGLGERRLLQAANGAHHRRPKNPPDCSTGQPESESMR